jgi:cell division cycle 14
MPNSFYFNIDSELVYEPFCSDFGPLNLASTYKFCIELEKLLRAEEYSACKIYHFTTLVPNKRANSAYLMGAFQILILKRSAEEAWKPFIGLPPFTPFRDASFGGCTYQCTILHCLKGLQFAVQLGWFSMSTFNLTEYETSERVENGDFNWIVPNKLLAFSCPAPNSQDGEGWRTWTPEDYVPLFRRLGVTAVVRLNQKTYEADRFTRLGMRHYDLYFLDGSVPSDAIVKRFLHIAESEPGAIAVHCKAGLGRTGTLIGCYAMKHFRFLAPDFIGYIRICRPGSVLGPQQQFLCEVEQTMHRLGEEAKTCDSLADRFGELEVSEEPKFESPHMSPRKA